MTCSCFYSLDVLLEFEASIRLIYCIGFVGLTFSMLLLEWPPNPFAVTAALTGSKTLHTSSSLNGLGWSHSSYHIPGCLQNHLLRWPFEKHSLKPRMQLPQRTTSQRSLHDGHSAAYDDQLFRCYHGSYPRTYTHLCIPASVLFPFALVKL